uniref:Uncharacterized protein n=1 Tax=Heterorhabditis bacteriophora TaxID=37862 RepID=A0A1I7WPF5_HETBA
MCQETQLILTNICHSPVEYNHIS